MALVYLVDDDEGTRDTLACGLRLAGHAAATAPSGTQGLQIIAQQSPDLLIIDLHLGDMTGLQVIDELRRRGIELPFILISGFGTFRAAARAMKVGAVDFLEKPLAVDLLIGAVERALALRLPSVTTRDAHADGYRRWADAVAATLETPLDPKTTTGWSAMLRVSPETLRGWCKAAGVKPKASLDLARVLRAVHQASKQRVSPERFFDAADMRTLSRLLRRGGVDSKRPATVLEVVGRQTFVTDQTARRELQRRLAVASVKKFHQIVS